MGILNFLHLKKPTEGTERSWDSYARSWNQKHPDLKYIGQEWSSFLERQETFERKLIAPYISARDTVVEIGCGGGRTGQVLLDYCKNLICADISQEMLNATRSRLGDSRVKYVKLNGVDMDNLEDSLADACFSVDTFYHMEPYDIFNYLSQFPRVLRNRKICIIHHSNILSEVGWQNFVKRYTNCLAGKRNYLYPSNMTPEIMQKFLSHLGYRILVKDIETLPRDCVWVCEAP